MAGKLHKYYDRFYFFCPGCKHAHCYDIPRWSFNNNLENPTFNPSLLMFYNHPDTGERVVTCHLWIKNGKIEFCGDCQHELRSQTVDMIDFPDNYDLPQEDK